ncbi:hypothetical protein ROZALSC1DRAFT_27588 [Rozella allomycis CSF55]|uniref:Uncharacterized protein n=1 Tax=Rozella allomycis (strain CSF55) TaxID=988480 RepID=A0A075ANU1_ROZAC|nr:hypothetical protein O9G_000081 [Rozella allomycis CSF55]RKP20976.1 hypothetical protein ROZALSC1DRAFT_27588 [Rozella allomycis CSF55]|eukprot:EPZ31602.1 hypothetical protein O9G_000081 [Rozella allomycis CSF55]
MPDLKQKPLLPKNVSTPDFQPFNIAEYYEQQQISMMRKASLNNRLRRKIALNIESRQYKNNTPYKQRMANAKGTLQRKLLEKAYNKSPLEDEFMISPPSVQSNGQSGYNLIYNNNFHEPSDGSEFVNPLMNKLFSPPSMQSNGQSAVTPTYNNTHEPSDGSEIVNHNMNKVSPTHLPPIINSPEGSMALIYHPNGFFYYQQILSSPEKLHNNLNKMTEIKNAVKNDEQNAARFVFNSNDSLVENVNGKNNAKRENDEKEELMAFKMDGIVDDFFQGPGLGDKIEEM